MRRGFVKAGVREHPQGHRLHARSGLGADVRRISSTDTATTTTMMHAMAARAAPVAPRVTVRPVSHSHSHA